MRPLTAQRPIAPAPRDPAPSRLDYRWQRMMLTPGFRAMVRIGVPLILIVTIAGSWFSHAENRTALNNWIEATKQDFQERPQFMVRGVNIAGADLALTAEVAALVPKAYPVSSFALDLEGIRAAVEGLDPVKSAAVRVGDAGMLEVAVTPRQPVALWRDGVILRLIDADGVASGVIATRADRLDLPLIAGDGAEQHIDEALALFAAAGPLLERARGLVRMGERRWDLVLDRDQRVLLPGDGAVAALQRIIALDQAQDMLNRDVAVVDMRNADRPTLRMNAEAAAALRRINLQSDSNGAGD
ncbi:MAG: cell division protein FtsQ/DivIB [Pseudomonadota bacterium]